MGEIKWRGVDTAADTGSTCSLLFISIHALNHILGYRLLSLGDTWLIAVSCCSLPPAMCWLIHRQRIWFSAWRSSCRNFHLRVLSDGPCWQNRVRKGTDFFFLGLWTRLWRDRRWTETDREQWNCPKKDSIQCDWVPWCLITLERREGKRIKSPIISLFFSLPPCALPFFISSKLLSPFLLCFSVSKSVCLSCSVPAV